MIFSSPLLRQLAVKNRQGKGSGPATLLWKAVHQLGWQCNIPGSSLAEMIRAWISLT